MYIKFCDIKQTGLHTLELSPKLYEDNGDLVKRLPILPFIIDKLKELEIPHNVQLKIDFEKPNTCAACGGENITHRYHRNEYICYKCETQYNEK